MAKEISIIRQEAQQVQNATQVGENTAQRVGGVLVDIVDKAEEHETDIDNLNANTGVDEYPTFSESTAYSAGDVVNYNGKLYKFTSDHAAGAWTGTDVEKANVVKAHIVQELGDSEDKVVSQKTVTEEITDIKSNLKTVYLSELLEYTTSTGLITNDGSLDTRSTHAVINVDGISRVRLVGSYNTGMIQNLYAFYNSTTPSASSLCGTIFRLDTTSEYDLYADVPDGAVILVVNMTLGSLTPYKLTPISYQFPNKIEEIDGRVENLNEIAIDLGQCVYKSYDAMSAVIRGTSVGIDGNLVSQFSHYEINVEGKKLLKIVGSTGKPTNVFAAFYSENEIASSNLINIMSMSDYVPENDYDILVAIPTNAKLFALNASFGLNEHGLSEAKTLAPISYQFPNKIEEVEEITRNSPIYSYNIEDFMYRDTEVGSPDITWNYNVEGIDAIKIMGLNSGYSTAKKGKIEFYDVGETLLSTREFDEIVDEYIDVPQGAVKMGISVFYTQRNTFFVYKAQKKLSDISYHAQYNTDSLNKNIFIKDRELLEKIPESITDGGYMCFSDKEDIEIIHQTPCDTGQNIIMNAAGQSILGITDGHVNFEEKGKPNFYLELKSKFGGLLNFMSCKFYKTGVVFLLGWDEWSNHMIHLLFKSPEDIMEESSAVGPGVRNDDSGDGSITGSFRVVYGQNKISPNDVRDDHIYEYSAYFAGEFIYIIKPNGELFVLQNITEDEYYKNKAILSKATSALWQNANLVEVCCGTERFANIAMRHAYRIKKMFNL